MHVELGAILLSLSFHRGNQLHQTLAPDQLSF